MTDWAKVRWNMHDAMLGRTASGGGGCEHCGETDEFSPNVEAFELSGELVCDDCADTVFEENGQFGVGA